MRWRWRCAETRSRRSSVRASAGRPRWRGRSPQRRAPNVYLRDSGLLHALLGIATRDALFAHPKAGASWEGFALEQVLTFLPVRDAYYWAVHSGPELDLLLLHRGQRIGVELKFTDAPSRTRSMTAARRDLALDKLWVVYLGEQRYPLDDGIEALPLAQCREVLAV